VIGFYVIMIAVLALSGAVGYTVLTSVRTTNALSLAERNAARLEMTTTALRQVVVADGEGRLFVPMTTPSITGDPTTRGALPDWVSGEAVTPWGADYAYCPYAPVSAPGGTAETVYGGANYAVNVSSDPVVYGASRDYVISGARSPNGLDAAGAPEVLAFLISPSNNATATPSCADVYWDGRAWLTTGSVTGSVRAVTVDGLADALSQAPRQLRRHVEQGATGSGLTASDPTSISRVLEEWRYLRPHRMTVVLEDDGGDVLIDPTTVDLGAGSGSETPAPNGFARHLVFEAAAGAAPVLNGSVAGVLRVPFDLTVDGVDFGADLGLSGLPGSRLLITDASLPLLDTGGGEVVLAGGVSVSAPVGASLPPVRINGGDLLIAGATTIDSQESGGSAILQQGGALTVRAALTVDTGASAPLFDGSGSGPVSATSSGTLDLNGAGSVSMGPYTFQATATSSCASGSLSCPVTCPDDRPALSGTCDPGAVTNVFLRGSTLSGDTFTCLWSQVSESSLDVTDPTGPIAPQASALCAPKR
jgi:hypothetical protein